MALPDPEAQADIDSLDVPCVALHHWTLNKEQGLELDFQFINEQMLVRVVKELRLLKTPTASIFPPCPRFAVWEHVSLLAYSRAETTSHDCMYPPVDSWLSGGGSPKSS